MSLKGPVKGEFLYNYDKIRISKGIAKDRTPSFTELEIYELQNFPTNFYSLAYIYGGDAKIYVDGEKFIIPENSLVVVDRFSVVVICRNERRGVYWTAIDFKPELFGRVGENHNDFNEMLKYIMGTFPGYKFDMPKGFYVRDRTGRIEYLFNNSWEEYKNRNLKYVDIIRGNIRTVLIELARNLGCFQDNCIKSGLIQRIVDYCEIYYSDRITIKTLSERFNYSESYITKMFKKELGMPFSEWLRQKRIYNSAGKLASNNDKISEVAKSVGYNDTAYFSECFERYIGMTPTEYRMQVRKSKRWFIGSENLKRQKELIEYEE